MKGRRGFISWAPKAKVRSQPAIPQAEDRYRFFSALLLVQGGLPPAFGACVLWIGERRGLWSGGPSAQHDFRGDTFARCVCCLILWGAALLLLLGLDWVHP